MNERVYVSAVADRVNVGKDEGLRFSGWIELERGRGGRGNEDDRGRIRVAGKQTTPPRVCGDGGKNFALPARVSAAGGRAGHTYIYAIHYVFG